MLKLKPIKLTKKELEFIEKREVNYKELGEAFEYVLPPINLDCFGTSEGEDLIKKEKRRAFIKRRREAMSKVMKNYPEGLTGENYQKIKDEVKKEEKDGV